VSAAVNVADVVGKGEDIFCITVVVLEGRLAFHPHFRICFGKINRIANGGFALVQIFHKGANPVSIMKNLLFAEPVILECDMDTGIQVRQFAHPFEEGLVFEFYILKNLRIRHKGNACSVFAAGRADLPHRPLRHTADTLKLIMNAVAPDVGLEPFAECIDDTYADAVQTAGDPIGLVVKFPSGVQRSQDNLQGADAGFGVNLGRNADAVVFHRTAAVHVNMNKNLVAPSG